VSEPEWRRCLQEGVDESRRRRAGRAAARSDLNRRRVRGLEIRTAERLMRADLDAAQTEAGVAIEPVSQPGGGER
jgi:hypothetical protein